MHIVTRQLDIGSLRLHLHCRSVESNLLLVLAYAVEKLNPDFKKCIGK